MEELHLEAVQWRGISHVDCVSPLETRDYEVLKEIGNVLRKHGMADRFGVCLLHRHFDLKDDEMMLEETDLQNRQMHSRIVSMDRVPTDHIETMWKFSSTPNSITRCVLACDFYQGHKRVHKRVGG